MRIPYSPFWVIINVPSYNMCRTDKVGMEDLAEDLDALQDTVCLSSTGPSFSRETSHENSFMNHLFT